jgi:hypothetical protein
LLSVQIRDLLDLTLTSPTDKISIDQKEIEMITRQAGIAMALAARSSAIWRKRMAIGHPSKVKSIERCTVLLTVGRYLKGS